jgi:acyl-CoA synthetase (AMP-forming)/AMP-acid ligase II
LAAVIGQPDQDWGERIEAYLVSKNPALTGQKVSEYCADHDLLPTHLLPKAFYFRETLPTGPTGKLYRRGLKTTQ